jgi:hypothetical protein
VGNDLLERYQDRLAVPHPHHHSTPTFGEAAHRQCAGLDTDNAISCRWRSAALHMPQHGYPERDVDQGRDAVGHPEGASCFIAFSYDDDV